MVACPGLYQKQCKPRSTMSHSRLVSGPILNMHALCIKKKSSFYVNDLLKVKEIQRVLRWLALLYYGGYHGVGTVLSIVARISVSSSRKF